MAPVKRSSLPYIVPLTTAHAFLKTIYIATSWDSIVPAYIYTRIKNIKNVTRCRDSRSAKSIETR